MSLLDLLTQNLIWDVVQLLNWIGSREIKRYRGGSALFASTPRLGLAITDCGAEMGAPSMEV